jgi:uncharacterized membrane protein
MITVTLFTRQECHLCDEAKGDLEALQKEIPHKLIEIDIDHKPELQQAHGLDIPVVQAGPFTLKAPFTKQDLQMTLAAAADRERHIQRIHEAGIQENIKQGWSITRADRFSYWLSNHYMMIFNLFVFIYVGLPFLAPTFMAIGWTTPSRMIYRSYGAVCHQLAFRSWFLFGEQVAYPKASAQVAGLTPYEQATGLNPEDLWEARDFMGNLTLGYKVALCERDVAIYGSILAFGLIFVATGRRIWSLPWYIWILAGIFPIGADGFSQILSQPPLNDFMPFRLLDYRESTPFLRTLTGGLFGFTTAWFGYPLVEESMADTRRYMAEKFSILKKRAENRSEIEEPSDNR